MVQNHNLQIGLVHLVPLGLAVAAAIRRRGIHPYTLLLILGLIVYYTLIHMLVIARLRFIIPVMPYVIALASDECIYLATKLGSRWKTPSQAVVLVILFGGFIES